MKPWATALIATGLLAILADLEHIAKHGAVGYTRRAHVVTVSQDGFWPDAQGSLWDIWNLAYDDDGPYFVPIDPTAPLNTQHTLAQLGPRHTTCNTRQHGLLQHGPEHLCN